jgi:hypothetical protein
MDGDLLTRRACRLFASILLPRYVRSVVVNGQRQ